MSDTEKSSYLMLCEFEAFQEMSGNTSTKAERVKYLKELKKDAPQFLRFLLMAYDETRNPLFLWRIYNVCCLLEQPVPKLVLDYLNVCAVNLLEIAHRIRLDEAITKKKPKGNEYAGEDCLKALRMYKKHKLNAFAEMKQYLARYVLMQDIAAKEKENLSNGMAAKKAKMDAIKTIHVMQDRKFRSNPISEPALYSYYTAYKKNLRANR